MAVFDHRRGSGHGGRIRPARDCIFNLKNNGVGLGTVSPKVNEAIVAKTKAIQRADRRGKIKVKPTIKF